MYTAADREYLQSLARREQDAAKKVLEQQIEAAQPDAPAANARAMVLAGYPAETIPVVAREEDADLLVVGTHARKGFQHLVLGSVAERVVRTATCAVLTVRVGSA